MCRYSSGTSADIWHWQRSIALKCEAAVLLEYARTAHVYTQKQSTHITYVVVVASYSATRLYDAVIEIGVMYS
jgi:hypothetical protein